MSTSLTPAETIHSFYSNKPIDGRKAIATMRGTDVTGTLIAADTLDLIFETDEGKRLYNWEHVTLVSEDYKTGYNPDFERLVIL